MGVPESLVHSVTNATPVKHELSGKDKCWFSTPAVG